MLRVGGVTPLSASDWPGQLSAVVFCQGCPWRCGYCHNPELIAPRSDREIPWREVMDFLQRRQGLLDAVVFSGGEPTLQAGLPQAMRAARALGYKIGLHTGGMYPRRLAAALPFADWVGMDVKAPFAEYARITGMKDSGTPVRESLQLLLASNVAHEIRTTVHPALLADDEVEEIAHELVALGVKHYVVQAFRSQGCSNEILRSSAPRARPLQELGADLAENFETFLVRA
ncbi:anaerobic ribonucleoside-triphosphate reductase activating protein [Betaproteobacteria bacterium SCN2]|nr:anaerobic ribonucleoside-triphosphate reductase activating protein [Betaproteobacteria bacterium SCN2]